MEGKAIHYKDKKIISLNQYKDGYLQGIQTLSKNSNSKHFFFHRNYYIGTLSQEKNECSICWENAYWKTDCNHYLCRDCIPQLRKFSCPMCRKSFRHKKIDF